MPETYHDRPVLRMSLLGKGRKRNVVYIHDKIIQDVVMDYVTKNQGYDRYFFLEISPFKGRQRNINSENLLIKMNYQWYWADLKQALQTVGISKDDFSTHDFRRCFARRAWEKTNNIHKLQRLLCHGDPKVTLRYLEQSGLDAIDYHAEMQR